MGYVLVCGSERSNLNIAAKAICSRPLTTIWHCKITNIFPSRKCFAKKKNFPQKETIHLRIRRMNQSSSRLNPQKVLPSPPKSHGSVTSIGLFGSRSYWPLPIIIRSRRRNLRLQNCFPRFCDLQQQQVLAGVLFLLLLIMSRMLRVVAMSICATLLNITRL